MKGEGRTGDTGGRGTNRQPESGWPASSIILLSICRVIDNNVKAVLALWVQVCVAPKPSRFTLRRSFLEKVATGE